MNASKEDIREAVSTIKRTIIDQVNTITDMGVQVMAAEERAHHAEMDNIRLRRVIKRATDSAVKTLDGCFCDDTGQDPECEQCVHVRKIWGELICIEHSGLHRADCEPGDCKCKCKWTQKDTGIWATACGAKMAWLVDHCISCDRDVEAPDVEVPDECCGGGCCREH